jgi:hypothetical protein
MTDWSLIKIKRCKFRMTDWSLISVDVMDRMNQTGRYCGVVRIICNLANLEIAGLATKPNCHD